MKQIIRKQKIFALLGLVGLLLFFFSQTIFSDLDETFATITGRQMVAQSGFQVVTEQSNNLSQSPDIPQEIDYLALKVTTESSGAFITTTPPEGYLGTLFVKFAKWVPVEDRITFIESYGSSVLDSLAASDIVLISSLNRSALEKLQRQSEVVAADRVPIAAPLTSRFGELGGETLLLAQVQQNQIADSVKRKQKVFILENHFGKYDSRPFTPIPDQPTPHGEPVLNAAIDEIRSRGAQDIVEIEARNLVADEATGTTDVFEILRGVRSAVDEGADVISLSYAIPPNSPPAVLQEIDDVFEEARQAGVTIVTGSGNCPKHCGNALAGDDATLVAGAADSTGNRHLYTAGLFDQTNPPDIYVPLGENDPDGVSFAAPRLAVLAALERQTIEEFNIVDTKNGALYADTVKDKLKEDASFGAFGEAVSNGDQVAAQTRIDLSAGGAFGEYDTGFSYDPNQGVYMDAFGTVLAPTELQMLLLAKSQGLRYDLDSREFIDLETGEVRGRLTLSDVPEKDEQFERGSVPSARSTSLSEDQNATLAQANPSQGSAAPGTNTSTGLSESRGAGGLVPCSGPDCQACHLVQLADNVIKFFMTLAVIAGTIAFVWAGFLYLTAAPNPAQIEKAHKIFWNVLIGLVIVLASFLIVDIIIRTLTDKNLNVVGKIQCVQQPSPSTSVPSGDSTGGVAAVAPDANGEDQPDRSCSTCVDLPTSIPTNGNACTQSTCRVDAELADKLVLLQKRAATDQYNLSADGWRVSEAWPPVATHQAECHYNGTCVDVSFSKLTTAPPKNVKNFIEAASGAQLRAVYEVQTESRRQQLTSQGVTNVIVVPGINREHFSIYND